MKQTALEVFPSLICKAHVSRLSVRVVQAIKIISKLMKFVWSFAKTADSQNSDNVHDLKHFSI